MPSGVRPSAEDGIDVRAGSDEQFGNIDQTLERNTGQRRLPLGVSLVGIGATSEQQPHGCGLIVVRGQHQQRVAARGSRVGGHPGVQRPFERIEIPTARGVGSHAGECRADIWSDGDASTVVWRHSPAPDSRRRAATRGDAVGNPAAELGVGFAEVLDRSRDDVVARDLRQAAGDVVDQPLLRVPRLQAIQIARLLEVVYLARHLRVVARRAGQRRSRRSAPRWSAPGRRTEFGS